MENQLNKSKFMYYFIVFLTIFILFGNLMILIITTTLTKPIYTRTLDYGSGVTVTLISATPIYPILKTNQVALIVVLLLVNMAFFGYFLFCFLTNKIKITKILGIILYGLTAVSSLIRLKILIAVLSLLVVGYLFNIKTNGLTKTQK